MPYYRSKVSQLTWVGFKNRTIDNVDEIVHYTHDSVAFNTLLTSICPKRCLVAVQRSACTSIDSQHTGHLYALMLGQKVWLCRDNVGPWTPTIEYDSTGLSKKMSKFYNGMLNRATRIEVYWLEGVPRTNKQLMLQYPDEAATANPEADLRSIMLKGRGRPKKQ